MWALRRSQPGVLFTLGNTTTTPVCIVLCYLVFFCTCHLNTGFRIIFLAIGSVKERSNSLLLCNCLLAKLNFEVNYEPQLPSQCTSPKEGYNLRTLEKTVTMVYTTLIGAYGSFWVPVSLRWSVPPPPLVLVHCVDLLYIILQAF
jgi:hypothetical protein